MGNKLDLLPMKIFIIRGARYQIFFDLVSHKVCILLEFLTLWSTKVTLSIVEPYIL